MPKRVVEIDSDSGFCFGVVNAITKAEKELDDSSEPLYCLGDIVHNGDEVKRLSDRGLRVIEHSDLKNLGGSKVLLRAHGEPPSTYREAENVGIRIIDATCPVVLKLQQRIRKAYLENSDAQIVIFGKNGHAEVNGLVGQTNGEAIVVENETDTVGLGRIDFSRNIILFSQTTKPIDGFQSLSAYLESRMEGGATLVVYDTICRQVAGRQKKIESFARRHDVVLFVGGIKSSNAKALFSACAAVNSRSHFIQNVKQIQPEWFMGAEKIGICGATSTPRWQMEQIAKYINNNFLN